MRQGCSEIRDRGRTIVAARRRRRQGKPLPLTADTSQHGIHEPGRAPLAHLSCEIHRVLDRRRRRDPIQVQQLKHRQPQNVDDLGIQLGEGTVRERLDHMIERALPSQCASGDFSRKRAVALVGEAPPRGSQCGTEIDTAAGDTPQHFVCRESRGCNHLFIGGAAGGRRNRAPRGIRWPARKSRAFIGRLPSGWIIRIRRTAPSPAATRRSPFSPSMIVPPGSDVRRSVSAVRCIWYRAPSRTPETSGHGCRPRTRL